MPEHATAADDRLLLQALADGELDAATALALERRLATEPALNAEFKRIMALKKRIAQLDRPEVSAEFLSRITATAASSTAKAPAIVRTPQRLYQGSRAIAASVIITALVASSTTYMLQVQRPGFSVEEAVAGSHRRSLLASSPVDIASSDRHTVKPWLDAKLGISPPATDLAARGYPLLGGRVDVLGSNTVPTLVYRHNEHLITLMAVPGAKSASETQTEITGGYNIVHWSQGGFSFWAVSDLEPAELQAFVSDYRSK